MLKVLTIITFFLFALASLKYFLAPWFWILVILAGITFFFFMRSKDSNKKALFFNLFVIVTTFAGAELYFYLDSPRQGNRGSLEPTEAGDSPELLLPQSDEILGYSYKNGVSGRVKKTKFDEIIYDVEYSIGENGLRITPSSNEQSADCLLFFGGSFTFGEGLNNNETLPHYVGEQLPGRFRILNYGLGGYGPHQMLAAIELGLVDRHTELCESRIGIYSGGYYHIKRLSGDAPWDTYGPKFILQDNQAVYDGRFSETTKSSVMYRVVAQFRKSFLYRKLIYRNKEYGIDSQNLFAAIVGKSGSLLNQSVTGDKRSFYIIYWDSGDKSEDDLIFALRNLNAEFIKISEAIPDKTDHSEKYSIKHDGHPNALANRRIASFLAERIRNSFPKNQTASE